jgi:signal transduction histidine kinase
MKPVTDSPTTSLTELATYLFARREAILANWRSACEADPALHTPTALSREEFNDNVPLLLKGLDQRLRAATQEVDIKHKAAEHGLHRWHKGYSLHELLTEMKYLHLMLMNELHHYWELYDEADKLLMVQAYELIAWFSNQTIDASVEQYTALQQLAANNRALALEKALEGLNELTRQRGDLLRTASHDLRSSFGIIQSAATLLEMVGDVPEEREQMQEMLNRNLASVREMIVQLMDLARLEAGQEIANPTEFNVAELVQTQLATYQPLATERGLMLTADGAADLLVECDSVLIQRILQNLVLNALKHTTTGLVSVSWSRENDYRWYLSVQDTGPGLPAESADSLAGVLVPTVDSASSFGQESPESPLAKPNSGFKGTGEGIGLSIVKRLCEVLRASLDIETQLGAGTLFRIRLPIKWDA